MPVLRRTVVRLAFVPEAPRYITSGEIISENDLRANVAHLNSVRTKRQITEILPVSWKISSIRSLSAKLNLLVINTEDFAGRAKLGRRPRRKVKHWTPKGDCKVAGIRETNQLQFY